MCVGILARALKTHWPELKEEVGLWIPVDIINKEHDDKPEDEEEFGKETNISFGLKNITPHPPSILFLLQN